MSNAFKGVFILLVFVFSCLTVWDGGLSKTNLKFGLDIIGGAHLKFRGEPTEQIPEITSEKMRQVEEVISNRINSSGTTEISVQRIGKDRILIEIPGDGVESVKEQLSRTAKLEFRELDIDLSTWINTGITGADLKRAQAVPDQASSSKWILLFEMKSDGAKKFSEMTGRLIKGTLPNGEQAMKQVLDNKGEIVSVPWINLPLAIFLDDQLISQASVRGQISTNGQIDGGFAKDEAVTLALQLNGGALPIPLKLIEERTVSPTLGKESLMKSLWAGLGGLLLIGLYMLLVYRLPGLLSVVALISYVVISLAIFTKMVTLSSTGIAGFILSIGMAVDANILIFERIKEELRLGKGIFRAVEEGFDKAFPSIFDSNLNTLLVCSILIIFGTGLVKGFAITLAIGVIVSFFSAIVITKYLMMIPAKLKSFHRPFLYGVNKL